MMRMRSAWVLAAERSRYQNALTVRLLFITIFPRGNQCVVYIARLDGIQQVQEEHGVAEAGILEGSHRARLSAGFDLLVGPSYHLHISYTSTVLAQRREGLIDRESEVMLRVNALFIWSRILGAPPYSPHQLPNETKHQGLGSIHNIASLDTDHVHLVGSSQFDGIIGVLHRFES